MDLSLIAGGLLLVVGLFAIAAGKIGISPTRVCRGGAARSIGLVLALALPLSFGISFGLGKLGTSSPIAVEHLPIVSWVIIACCALLALLKIQEGSRDQAEEAFLEARAGRTGMPILPVMLALLLMVGAVVGGVYLLQQGEGETGSDDTAEERATPLNVATTGEASVSGGMKIDPRFLPKGKKPVDDTEPSRPKTAVRIGVYGPKTGDWDWLGNSYAHGALLQFNRFKKSTKASLYDPQLGEADSIRGRGDLQRMLEEGETRTVAVIGHHDDDEANAAMTAYHESRALMMPLVPGGSRLIADSQSYRITYGDGYYAKSIVALVGKLGWRRINVFSDGSKHASQVADTLAFVTQSEGVHIVELGHIDRTKPETREAIAQKMVQTQPQATIVLTRNPKAALSMVRALAENGNKVPVLVTDGASPVDFARGLRGDNPTFKIITACAFDPSAEGSRAFVDEYKRMFKVVPDQWAALAYDLTGMFFDSLEEDDFNTAMFERYLRRRLRKESPYRGITGEIYFDKRGQAVGRPVVLLEWTGSRYTTHAQQLTRDEREKLFDLKPENLASHNPPKIARTEPKKPVTGSGGGTDPDGPPAERPPVEPRHPDDKPTRKPGKMVWHDNIEDALDEADESGKPILVDFFSKTCIPCLKMEKTTWVSEAFKKAAGGWVLLRINLDKDGKYTPIFKIKDLPVISFWTPSGAEGMRIASRAANVSGTQIVATMDLAKPRVRKLERHIKSLKRDAQDPSDPKPSASEKLGDLFRQKYQYSEAVSYFQEAQMGYDSAGKKDRAARISEKITRCYLSLFDFDGAATAATEWIEKHEKHRGDYAHFLLGYTQLKQRKFDEAAVNFKKMAKKYPRSAFNKRATDLYRKYAGKPLQ